MRLPVAVLAVLRGTQCFACRSHFQIGSVAISQCSSMFLDVSFAMTLRGFDEVMASMDEALPNLERQDFEDRWASVMSCLRCVSFWTAAGYGQPWTHVVVHRLHSLSHFCIWGARATDLARHASTQAKCVVPTRYKIQLDGWRRIHGGDQYLCESALRTRELLCRLVRRLSTRQECRRVMLWCLLALDLLTKMRFHILTQLRAADDESGAGC